MDMAARAAQAARLGLAFALVLAGCLWAAASFAADAPGLEDRKGWLRVATTSDGIEIYTKAIPGSEVPAVMLRKRVAVAPDAFLAVVEDRAGFADLARDLYVAESVVLASRPRPRGDSTYEDVYTRLEFPAYLPVSDRVQVIRIWTDRDQQAPGHYRVAWKAMPKEAYAGALDRRGVPADAVYMDRSSGSWELRPLAGGGTEVVYRTLSDPGGDFPAFLVERSHQEQLPSLLRAMEREAVRRQSAGLRVAGGG